LLSSKAVNATPTILHSQSKNIEEVIRDSDIVVAAIGQPEFVKKDWIKPGAACLDVGISRVSGRLVGDVQTSVQEVAGYFSPNPGGVGPMTRAMLLSNVLQLATKVL
jgi:methylenetetrahydrofolate dehydrogenase (NADP+)/methenyltetrahydrofolate cyclohydrolase